MSINIERELHNLLLDLAPRSEDDLVDQATVIAEASAIFDTMARTAGGPSKNNTKWVEAKMLDSLLEAMQISYASADEYDNDSVIDATNLTPEQIIHKAERLRPIASNPEPMNYDKPFGNNMCVLNDDDLEPFYNNTVDGRTMDDYTIEDMSLLHPSNVYTPPGWGKNRSDSHAR